MNNVWGVLVLAWTVFWAPGPQITQRAGECVGAAWVEYLAAQPCPCRTFNAHILYQLGRAEAPDRDPYLHLVGQALLRHNVITRQAYTQDLATARAWLRAGPVLVAGRWPGTTYEHAGILFALDSRGRWYYQSSWPPYRGTFTTAQLQGMWFGRAEKLP